MCFNCSKCLHKCKAICCSIIPIEKEFFESHEHLAIRPVVEKQEMFFPKIEEEILEDLQEYCKIIPEKMHVVPITEDAKCCFLKEDLSCAIYEERPRICRDFGNEKHLYLTCIYQTKDGNVRSRQERRSLERTLTKRHEKFLQIGEKNA